MKTLTDDTAVDAVPLADEGRAPRPAVLPGGFVARLRRLALRTSVLVRPRVAKRPSPMFRGDGGPPRSDLDAGLTRGASLLFGEGPRRR